MSVKEAPALEDSGKLAVGLAICSALAYHLGEWWPALNAVLMLVEFIAALTCFVCCLYAFLENDLRQRKLALAALLILGVAEFPLAIAYGVYFLVYGSLVACGVAVVFLLRFIRRKAGSGAA